MSINVTVHGNPVSIRRGKMLLVDPNFMKETEVKRRRNLRIEQVRQRSKDIAHELRQKVKLEREKQLNLFERQHNIEMKKTQARKLLSLQKKYQECLEEVGAAHTQAALQPDVEVILREGQERIESEAQKRGRTAEDRFRQEKEEQEVLRQAPRKQHKYSRTMEDLRSAMVASLNKKTPQKIHRKEPLHETHSNMMESTVNASSEIHYSAPGGVVSVHVTRESVHSSDVNETKPKRYDVSSFHPEDNKIRRKPFRAVKQPSKRHLMHDTGEDNEENTKPSADRRSPRRRLNPRSAPDDSHPRGRTSDGQYKFASSSLQPQAQSERASSRSQVISQLREKLCSSLAGALSSSEEEVPAPEEAPGPPPPVQLFDYNGRFTKEYKPCAVVCKLDTCREPDANEAAEKTQHEADEDSRKLDMERRRRRCVLGIEAQQREKGCKDYKLLLQDLSDLSKKERVIRSISIPVDAFLDEDRRQERKYQRQRVMDSLFENVVFEAKQQEKQKPQTPALPIQEQSSLVKTDMESSTLVEHTTTLAEETPPAKLNVGIWHKVTSTNMRQNQVSVGDEVGPSSEEGSILVGHISSLDTETATYDLSRSNDGRSSMLQSLIERAHLQRTLLLKETDKHETVQASSQDAMPIPGPHLHQDLPTREAFVPLVKKQGYTDVYQDAATSEVQGKSGTNKYVMPTLDENLVDENETMPNEILVDENKEQGVDDIDVADQDKTKYKHHKRYKKHLFDGEHEITRNISISHGGLNDPDNRRRAVKSPDLVSDADTSVTVISEVNLDMSLSRRTEHSCSMTDDHDGSYCSSSTTTTYEGLTVVVNISEKAEKKAEVEISSSPRAEAKAQTFETSSRKDPGPAEISPQKRRRNMRHGHCKKHCMKKHGGEKEPQVQETKTILKSVTADKDRDVAGPEGSRRHVDDLKKRDSRGQPGKLSGKIPSSTLDGEAHLQGEDVSKKTNWKERLEMHNVFEVDGSPISFPSSSSSYMSPPDIMTGTLSKGLMSLLANLQKQQKQPPAPFKSNPQLAPYIKRLLAMSTESIEELGVSSTDVSLASLVADVNDFPEHGNGAVENVAMHTKAPFLDVRELESDRVSPEGYTPQNILRRPVQTNLNSLIKPDDFIAAARDNLFPIYLPETQPKSLTPTTSPLANSEAHCKRISYLSEMIQKIRLERQNLVDYSLACESQETTKYMSPPPSELAAPSLPPVGPIFLPGRIPTSPSKVPVQPLQDERPAPHIKQRTRPPATSWKGSIKMGMQELPHELSAIIEVDTPHSLHSQWSSRVAVLSSRSSSSQSTRRSSKCGANPESLASKSSSTSINSSSTSVKSSSSSSLPLDGSPSNADRSSDSARDVSFPDVMAEMFSRGIITSPLAWTRLRQPADNIDQHESARQSEEDTQFKNVLLSTFGETNPFPEGVQEAFENLTIESALKESVIAALKDPIAVPLIDGGSPGHVHGGQSPYHSSERSGESFIYASKFDHVDLSTVVQRENFTDTPKSSPLSSEHELTADLKKKIMGSFTEIPITSFDKPFLDLGMSWAETTLRKTLEAQALSPSSSSDHLPGTSKKPETRRNVSSNDTEQGNSICLDKSLPRHTRGHSTPVSNFGGPSTDASPCLETSSSRSHITFAGESEISSVQHTSSSSSNEFVYLTAPQVSLKPPNLQRLDPNVKRGS